MSNLQQAKGMNFLETQCIYYFEFLLALFNPLSFFRQINISSRDSNCAWTHAAGGCR